MTAKASTQDPTAEVQHAIRGTCSPPVTTVFDRVRAAAIDRRVVMQIG